MGPIPSQLVKDSRTDPTAGNQTSQRTSRVGTTTISVTTTRSTELRWSMPLYLRLATRTSSVGAATGLGRMRGILPRPRSLGAEDALLLVLDAVAEPVDVLGVLQEGLDGRDHHRGREVGAGVAVHELGDGLGLRDELHRLLLEGGVRGLVGLVVRRDDARVGLDDDVLGVRRADVAEELLGARLVLRALGHHVAVDGRLDGVRADGGVDLREVEEGQVVLLGTLAELLGDERPEQVGAGLLLLERLGGLLPGA